MQFADVGAYSLMIKEILSACAIALTFIGFLPYIASIQKRETQPHLFSWIIWGLTTFIVFFAQLGAGGGAGAWPIGVSGLITFYIAILAYRRRADTSITRTDIVFFVMALGSLPLWYLTANPLWAVVVLTLADVLGFGPTLRKAYGQPFAENLLFFFLFAVRNALAILALEQYSITTVLFPAATGVACVVVVLVLAWRRRELASRPPTPS